jgi:hypothetical protein
MAMGENAVVELTFMVSALGFLVALGAHLLSALGVVNVPLSTAFGAFFLLMILGVASNAYVIVQRRFDYDSLPPGEFWRFITRSAPEWMRSLQVGLLLYAVFNFYFTMLYINRGAYPRIVDGGYVLERHKVVIETLTRSEYLWHGGFVVRMLSAIVMAVYFGGVMRWIARWRTLAAPQPHQPGEEAVASSGR